MKKLFTIISLVLIVCTLPANDIIILASSARVVGNLDGVISDHVGIATKDGVVTYYPVSMVSKVYKGSEDVTSRILSKDPALLLGFTPLLASGDSLVTISGDTALIAHQLKSLNKSTQIISATIGLSIAVGILAWLYPKTPSK